VQEKDIVQLVEQQRERHSLAREFYTDPDIYERDIERIYLRAWLDAGHESEIPQPGDWFLFEFAGESVIVARGLDGEIRAMLNVCRHRGSRICLERSGCSKRLTCRYHAWTYDLEGNLVGAPRMNPDFDKSAVSLRRVHVERLDGMIFVNFADQPADFGALREGLADCLRPYGLADAKVAHRQTYPIAANWKLAVENYCECYHCAPAHPEYSRGHSLAHQGQRSGELHDAVMARAAACGLSDRSVNRMYFDAPAFGADFGYERYPLIREHLTGSDDGRPVAPLLGSIRDYDGGATDLQVGPVTFGLMYCDHVVLYRFTPVTIDKSECDITWLVRGDAVEGQDYDRDRLTWLWDVTTHADKAIIEHNQQGVNSRYYVPGPLSSMENFAWSFLSWYLEIMRSPLRAVA
jgi:phenylpropionate dioxygenase-like ring-hydroxylating dioxygenase large terminal subunit